MKISVYFCAWNPNLRKLAWTWFKNEGIFFIFFSETTACYADQDDDIIFEDFARLRLKGETDAWLSMKIQKFAFKRRRSMHRKQHRKNCIFQSHYCWMSIVFFFFESRIFHTIHSFFQTTYRKKCVRLSLLSMNMMFLLLLTVYVLPN